ncbi:MAG: hypothetical protein ABIQ57_10155 [Candidatus Kapaibacterium sp.]
MFIPAATILHRIKKQPGVPVSPKIGTPGTPEPTTTVRLARFPARALHPQFHREPPGGRGSGNTCGRRCRPENRDLAGSLPRGAQGPGGTPDAGAEPPRAGVQLRLVSGHSLPV